MKLKPDSWNDAPSATSERGVRRSLTRAGLQLGALTHVVSDALSTLQSGSNARVSAQNRMKALLNQDRALLAHRPFAQADLVEEPEATTELPRKIGKVTKGSARTAAQNRMRELLNQDRAMLAFRAREGLDADEDLDELLEYALRGGSSETSTPSAAGRSTCVGATTSFVAEESVPSVCTPGPLPEAEAHVHAAVATPARPAVAVAAPAPIPAPAPKRVEAPAATAVTVAPKVADAPAAAAVKADVKAEESASDPIRTRGMAKLLALQGYRDRALSIYDELIAAEPNNAELRAEADKLRGN